MKNKFLFCMLNILLITNIIGCGSVTPENSHVGEKEEIASVQEETNSNAEESPDDSTEEESSTEDAKKDDASNEEMSKKENLSTEAMPNDATEPDFGFEDLSKRQFIFTSGAGGWRKILRLKKTVILPENIMILIWGVLERGILTVLFTVVLIPDILLILPK